MIDNEPTDQQQKQLMQQTRHMCVMGMIEFRDMIRDAERKGLFNMDVRTLRENPESNQIMKEGFERITMICNNEAKKMDRNVLEYQFAMNMARQIGMTVSSCLLTVATMGGSIDGTLDKAIDMLTKQIEEHKTGI